MPAPDLAEAVRKVRTYSMLANEALLDLGRMVQTIVDRGIEGDFVECGVWKGGASFLMADVLRQAGVRGRKVWLFDSFEGLPMPQAVDGAEAQRYAREPNDPYYYNNCLATLDEVQRAARDLELTPYLEFVEGWFDRTLPSDRARIGPIALLRLDCDWYASVRCCLEQLYDQVSPGGFIAVDDYYHLDGCALAVNEFLGTRHLDHRIEGIWGNWTGIEVPSGVPTGGKAGAEGYLGAVLRKGGTDSWLELRQVHLMAGDIIDHVPAGAPFIFVDYSWSGEQVYAGRRAVPLYGAGRRVSRLPDAMTLQAMERQRVGGAQFLVFGRSAFWWLGGESGLAALLHSRYHAVFQNDRIMVFDMR